MEEYSVHWHVEKVVVNFLFGSSREVLVASKTDLLMPLENKMSSQNSAFSITGLRNAMSRDEDLPDS